MDSHDHVTHTYSCFLYDAPTLRFRLQGFSGGTWGALGWTYLT